jgi:hypothetical protein
VIAVNLVAEYDEGNFHMAVHRPCDGEGVAVVKYYLQTMMLPP